MKKSLYYVIAWFFVLKDKDVASKDKKEFFKKMYPIMYNAGRNTTEVFGVLFFTYILIISLLWWLLEYLINGSLNPNTVDTILTVIFAIWFSYLEWRL